MIILVKAGSWKGFEKIIVENLGTCFRDLLDIVRDRDKLKSFRSRARDMPTEIFIHGLTYTLMLAASRGDLNILEKTIVKNECKELVKVVNSIDSKEKFGYTMYTSLILFLFRKLNIDLGLSFRDILNKVVGNNALEKKAYIIADWIKRFAEAYIAETK